MPEDLSPTRIRAAIRAGRLGEVLSALDRLPPVRRAELFLLLRPAEQMEILRESSPGLAASILSDCDSATLSGTLRRMDLTSIAPALRAMAPDNLADIVLRLPPGPQKGALDLLDPPLMEEVRKLLTFDPESAGGLMSPRCLSVPDVVTVGRALELLRSSSSQSEGSSYIYIVDASGRLAGVAPLRRLLLANPRGFVREVMVKDVVRVKVSAGREEIAGLFGQYHFVSLPVVDDKDRLVGIVGFDAVRAALLRAEQAVVRGITGVDPREALKETFAATRGRIPWITVTILGGLGCAVVGGLFQDTLSELVVLGIFIPIVLALGESIGAQTTSVVLATLSGRALSRTEMVRFATKETLVGLLVAVYSGVVVSATSLLWHGNPRLGCFIGASVLISVAWAALLAVFIPGLMRRLRVNPAIASGPLVLALADLSTLLVYFGGASVYLSALK